MRTGKPHRINDLIERSFNFKELRSNCEAKIDLDRLYEKLAVIIKDNIHTIHLNDESLIYAVVAYHIITSVEISSDEAWVLYKQVEHYLNDYQRLILLCNFTKKAECEAPIKENIGMSFRKINTKTIETVSDSLKQKFVESNSATILRFIND